MTLEQRSGELFARHQALRVYATIARFPKDEFTTGQVEFLSGVPKHDCSRELKRLVRLELVQSLSRRGDYRRVAGTRFWEFADALASEWGE